jgi:2-polyprenyl-3-methyl-5-hydroxy-6-metoxy-1,4-benzoquinol methylase
MKLSTFYLRLDLIRKYKKVGKVLDVGCATGYFLEAARTAGFTPYGVEFSPYSSQIAKDKFGDEAIYQGTLEECPFPARSFDVIAMSDLLEHVKNPRAVLKKARTLLKDDGIVMIMTPDTGSLTHRVMRDKWVHYKIEHLFYFNRDSLNLLAEEQGFRIIHVEPARKTLNLAYFHHQFKVYRHRLMSPVLKLLHTILPDSLQEAHFTITVGEMVAVLKKQP